MLRCMIWCLFVVHFQYAFTVKEESDVMIALMQEDTRKEKERGVENLTIGYFVMKVTIEWRWCELWKYKFKWRFDRRSGNCKLSNCKLNRIKTISDTGSNPVKSYHCDDHISTEKLNGKVKIKKLKTKMENWVNNKRKSLCAPPPPPPSAIHIIFILFHSFHGLK